MNEEKINKKNERMEKVVYLILSQPLAIYVIMVLYLLYIMWYSGIVLSDIIAYKVSARVCN